MELIVLKEGIYSVDKNKEFQKLDETSSLKLLKIAVQPFLVITKNECILLDAGLGQNENGIPLIHQNLQKYNIDPQQITKVLISHLHKDHIGGLLRAEKDGVKGNFPNAEIYIQQRELDYALTQSGNPSYNFDVLEKLGILDNLIFLNADNGRISDEISFEVSGGHSPYHQEFWINNDDSTIFYGADNLPQSGYLKLPSAFKNDFDGRKAMELRENWKKMASGEHWKMLFYHDIEIPFLDFPIR